MLISPIPFISRADLIGPVQAFEAGSPPLPAGTQFVIVPGAGVTRLKAGIEPSQADGPADTPSDWLLDDGRAVDRSDSVTVRDRDGVCYGLAAIRARDTGGPPIGFAFDPALPPAGQALTVVRPDLSAYLSPDAPLDPAFRDAPPAGFLRGSRIATPDGTCRVEYLRAGDLVVTHDAGPLPVAMILRCRATWPEGPAASRPVHFTRGMLGPNLPSETLEVAPWQRFLMRDDRSREWLVPARALSAPESGREGEAGYVHVVLTGHHLIMANGVWCESFWPGSEVMAALDPQERAAIEALLGKVEPVRPILSAGEVRRHPGPLSAPTTAAPGTFDDDIDDLLHDIAASPRG